MGFQHPFAPVEGSRHDGDVLRRNAVRGEVRPGRGGELRIDIRSAVEGLLRRPLEVRPHVRKKGRIRVAAGEIDHALGQPSGRGEGAGEAGGFFSAGHGRPGRDGVGQTLRSSNPSGIMLNSKHCFVL
jgi:hypothetical protein